MQKIEVKGQTVQPGERKQTNKRTISSALSPSFAVDNKWLQTNKNRDGTLFLKNRKITKFPLTSMDQLYGGCGVSRTFSLVTLAVEYLPLTQVYTFFWWRLYHCTDDLGYEPPHSSIKLLILKQ